MLFHVLRATLKGVKKVKMADRQQEHRTTGIRMLITVPVYLELLNCFLFGDDYLMSQIIKPN